MSEGKYGSAIIAFVVDYGKRHCHPLNAVFHVAGVPLSFYGLYKLSLGQPQSGLPMLVLGYLLQYLGHRAQGNEVGEVTLIKSVWGKLRRRRSQAARPGNLPLD